MLNEPLYKAIWKVFGEEPKIVNEGCPATLVDLHPTFSFVPRVEQLRVSQTSGGEQYVVNCPFCNDKKQRLYISYMWDSTFELEGTTYKASEYLMICFNERCLEDERHSSQIISALREAMQQGHTIDMSNAELTTQSGSIANQVPYPAGAKELTEAPDHVKQYIQNRGFTVEELASYKVKFLPCYGKFNHAMLMLPVYQNDEYYFWQGRLVPLDGTVHGEVECGPEGAPYPKYYIPYGAKKSWALGNIDDASMYDTIYVVEGLFDVYSVGKQAVCKFGRSLSRAQQNILQTKCRNKHIVLVPDMNDTEALPSAEEDRIKLITSGAFKSVNIAVLPEGTDPGMWKEKGENVCEILKSSISSQAGTTESVFGTPAWM